MQCSLREMRYKEVISVTDGSRYGYVGDVDIDLDSGQVRALIIPGQPRFFGLGLQFRVLTHTFTSPSVACITLVAYSMTLSSVISSRGRMVWICPW